MSDGFGLTVRHERARHVCVRHLHAPAKVEAILVPTEDAERTDALRSLQHELRQWSGSHGCNNAALRRRTTRVGPIERSRQLLQRCSQRLQHRAAPGLTAYERA